jgi:hypothetical protein
MAVPLRRLAAVLTIVLSLTIVLLLALRGMGVAVAIGPLASSTPVVSAAPSATATPGASTATDIQAILTAIEGQVRAERGLQAPSIGPAQLLSRAELEAELRRNFDSDYPPARRQADNVLLRALGLLSLGQDVGELQLKLLSGQVIGFYDDKTKRMAVISDVGLDASAKVTYAHEYTHALQDKAFGLASLDIQAVGEDDRDLARLALVEGDATTSMLLWALANLSQEELVGVGETPLPDTSGIPPWMLEQLEFPYTTGADFVARLRASGGWSAVDAVFKDPPASTEQVIHYEKYVEHEAPDSVQAPRVAAALGSGWQEVPADTLGEAMTSIWLKAMGVVAADADNAAEGWGGDRVVAASAADGQLAVAWHIAWDSPGDARQFTSAYAAAKKPSSLRTRLVPLSDHESLILQATSQAAVDRLAAALG